MSINKASRKVKMPQSTGVRYCNKYKDDLEKEIPLPRDQTPKMYTQEQIGNLIRYIDTDKMTVKEASAKANMTYPSARYYYNKYLEDPDHNIPIPQLHQIYTQDQKNEFIGYLINDKMSFAAASEKAKMKETAAREYYQRYFELQSPGIATPSHITTYKRYTQEQIKQVISYIVEDKMSIRAASRKAYIDRHTVGKHYQKYLVDNNMKLPVKRVIKDYTRDQINEVIRYIVEDKMSISGASKKADISRSMGQKYYRQYLKDHNIDRPIKKYTTQDQINQLIGYIVNDKMTITAASKKVNMSTSSAHRYYHHYLNDQNGDRPQGSRSVFASKNKE